MPTPLPYNPIKPGDMIGVMAPSSSVEHDDIERSCAFLEARGYRVFVHPQTYFSHEQMAGTRAEKIEALHALYARADIKAIWAAGGGNRALDLIDGLDYGLIRANPKPIVGFSDVTALLNAVYAHTGIAGIHGPVFKQLGDHQHSAQALAMLEGRDEAALMSLEGATVLRAGDADGVLIGGNLSVLQYLPQSVPKGFFEGRILFLEDCGDELSRIDRMFLHLKRVGVLGGISGLILGEFIDMGETGRPFGLSIEEIVMEHMEGTDCPIVADMPFGHGKKLYPMLVGGRIELNMTKHALTQYCS
jgi:muramoyltetrapeptide carboxypeptidase